jgi:nucleoside-diphosphate-sugar epimerase
MISDRINTMELFQNKVLVVGGRGFIGRALSQRLIELGADVVSLALRDVEGSLAPKDAEQVVADLRDPESLAVALYGRKFDYVFNAGGYIDHSHFLKGGREVIDAHYIGTLNLIREVYWRGIKRYVHIGSSDEYGNRQAPQNEELRESPIAPYSAAKTGITHLIQAISKTEDFPGVVVRLFLVYGPGQDDRRFLPQIIKGCLEDRTFPTSFGGQLRDFCYIADVVDGLILAALKQESVGHVINIASGTPVSVKTVIEKIVKMIGKGEPDFGVYPYRQGENMELYADVTLAHKLLGWRPSTLLDEGLRKTISWYEEHLKS